MNDSKKCVGNHFYTKDNKFTDSYSHIYCPSSFIKESLMILHIPHSSLFVPDTFKILEGVSLEHELQRMTDWVTDELFAFDEAEALIFPYNRLYCDVERFRVDKDESMAKQGMGVCYTQTSYGTELRSVGRKEKALIKATVYDEHHKKFDRLVEEELLKNVNIKIKE